MSSISSVGGTGLSQLLQQLNTQSQTLTLGQTQTSSTTSPSPAATLLSAIQDSDGDRDGSSASSALSAAGGQHRGHGHHHGLSSQLESAVTNALNSAGGTTDPNQVIQTAIQNLLAGNSNQTATSGASTAAGASSTNPTSQEAAFSQLLSSNGVDPSQFQQDLQSAIQGATSSGGSVDFAQLFQNFPPGSSVNLLA
jgi:hypothetical protein